MAGAVADHPYHALFDDRRRRLVAEARGCVLDVGRGTGRNLPYYRLGEGDGAAEVHDVAATELHALAEASFDTVVCAFVLCGVPDQAQVLAAMRRVLRPDGRLLFLEHVRAPRWRGRLQSVATPVWSRVGAPCRLDRDTLAALRAGGFAVTDCERSGAIVQGVARFSSRQAASS